MVCYKWSVLKWYNRVFIHRYWCILSSSLLKRTGSAATGIPIGLNISRIRFPTPVSYLFIVWYIWFCRGQTMPLSFSIRRIAGPRGSWHVWSILISKESCTLNHLANTTTIPWNKVYDFQCKSFCHLLSCRNHVVRWTDLLTSHDVNFCTA